MKERLIKWLGGYTEKEYLRIQRRYEGLLDSKIKDNSILIINEHIWKTLLELDKYAKTQLFGMLPSIWSRKMYNVIHNNLLRLMSRYLHCKSSVIYKIDTTLDEDNQFIDILKAEDEIDEVEYLIQQMATDD